MTTKTELLGILCLINQFIHSSELTTENRLDTAMLGKKMMDIALASYSGDLDNEIMMAVGAIYMFALEVQ